MDQPITYTHTNTTNPNTTSHMHLRVRSSVFTHMRQQQTENPKIISMENSRIRAKGTYRVIESKDYELIEEWKSIIAKENAKDETTWYDV